MNTTSESKPPARPGIPEDWLAVGLAFLLILLAKLGVFGEAGLPIRF